MIEKRKMLTTIDYSVAIRTLGNAGEKYVRTIKSIAQQSVPPKEIIVVIDDESKIPALYKLLLSLTMKVKSRHCTNAAWSVS